MGRIRRRRFLHATSVLLLGPLLAHAQRVSRIPVIGLLDGGERLEWWAAFREQMRNLGYIEGKNVAFEARYAKGKLNQLPPLAQELVRLKVDVIVTASSAAAIAARQATESIPIVTGSMSSHVSVGLVSSIARPGGNVTGLSSMASELDPKRVELLRELKPNISRLAAIWHADNVGTFPIIKDLETAALSAKIVLLNLGFRKPEELSNAFSTASKERADAVFVPVSPLTYTYRAQIGELAMKHRLISTSTSSVMVDAGLLFSYATSYADLFRRAAFYVDKILKGARAGDLPIEQPTKFDLVINLRTAKGLGVKVPQSILARADRVIE